MGKAEDEQELGFGTTGEAQSTSHNAEARGCWCFCTRLHNNFEGLVKGRCVIVLLFSAAVFLSALFWLPFFHDGNAKDLDLNSQFAGHDIVASFMLEKPISFLEDYVLLLEDNIFEEISFRNTKVEIVSLEPAAGSNITKVVFAVDSNVKNKRISSEVQSLIRASFESLVIRQPSLSFTASLLLGEPFSFDVLKFKGGITISPSQSAFLMQEVQIRFNFTLNFSIDQLLDNFVELRTQLKSGLRLASYENLYISLTNPKGSTVDPPAIVESIVVLAVGVNPSTLRRKQLAHTIIDSHSKNLGLNNTVFGRVKQVRLSSLPHSLVGQGPSPAPTPLPQHHHHHHPHHHHHNANHAPSISPAPQTHKSRSSPGQVLPTSAPVPAPAPWSGHGAKPPSCNFGYKKRYPRKRNGYSHLTPIMPPVSAPHIAPAAQQNLDPPAPSVHRSPASSPLPHVSFAHVQPPSKSEFDAEPPVAVPPSPSPSSADILSFNMWTALLFLPTILHL